MVTGAGLFPETNFAFVNNVPFYKEFRQSIIQHRVKNFTKARVDGQTPIVVCIEWVTIFE